MDEPTFLLLERDMLRPLCPGCSERLLAQGGLTERARSKSGNYRLVEMVPGETMETLRAALKVGATHAH